MYINYVLEIMHKSTTNITISTSLHTASSITLAMIAAGVSTPRHGPLARISTGRTG